MRFRLKQNSNSDAYAHILGHSGYPQLNGTVTFRQTDNGVLVTARVFGLPDQQACSSGVFGFHIHEGADCTGSSNDPFSASRGHYNPKGCPHPYHEGDLPPLFSNNGYAYMSVLTDRFSVSDIIGRVIIIHDKPDDFTSQPSGNAGNKIACGRIVR